MIDFTAKKMHILLFFLRKFHLRKLTFLIFMESLEKRVGDTPKYMGGKKCEEVNLEKVRNKDGYVQNLRSEEAAGTPLWGIAVLGL